MWPPSIVFAFEIQSRVVNARSQDITQSQTITIQEENMMKATVSALVVLASISQSVQGQEQGNFGVDVSFPMHHLEWSPLNEERREIYEDFMQGCRDYYGKKGARCDSTERDRIDMTLRQPQCESRFALQGTVNMKG